MQTQRVAIAGATGYAGEELIRILLQHSSVQITCLAASAKWDSPVALCEVYPHFADQLDLPVTALDPTVLAKSCDLAFLALPHGLSMDVAPTLLNAGCRVVDLGGDFRLHERDAFSRWYQKPHTHPELLSEAVYGVTELFRKQVQNAKLCANPGCFATSAILALSPLLKRGWIEPDSIIVDAKSGRSGAGRGAAEKMIADGKGNSLWPYKVDHHPHVPEIEQALADCTGKDAPTITFVPHVVPMERGIISTLYLRFKEALDWKQLDGVYRAAYGKEPFIRLLPEGSWPQAHEVVGTNRCDLSFTVDAKKKLIIVVAAIDNLLKGAAGQAVQNMNAMAGFPEGTGLS